MRPGFTQYTGVIALFVMLLAPAHAATGSDPDAFGYRFVLFIHQLLFVFWLGPDIGVYMWGTKLGNPELSPGQRVAAGRMMRMIELIPRACMSLMLTIGGILTEMKGIEHPWWQMAGIWLLGPVWLSLTLAVYFQAGSERGAALARLDEGFRWLVIFGVLISVAYSVATGRLAGLPWLTAKLLIFAAVVFFGLMLRRRMLPLYSALDRLENDGPSPELDSLMQSTLRSGRSFMVAAWAALAAAAALGMVQPGDAEVAAASAATQPLTQTETLSASIPGGTFGTAP
jgi:hypothetical protein